MVPMELAGNVPPRVLGKAVHEVSLEALNTKLPEEVPAELLATEHCWLQCTVRPCCWRKPHRLQELDAREATHTAGAG